MLMIFFFFSKLGEGEKKKVTSNLKKLNDMYACTKYVYVKKDEIRTRAAWVLCSNWLNNGLGRLLK
jgi:hypothetical protein